MATNRNNLNALIIAFKQIQTKDAISPDSLGSLLQQLLEIIPSESELANQIAAVAQDLERLDQSLDSLGSRIASAESDISTNGLDIGHLQEDVSRLWGDVNAKATDITALQSAVTELGYTDADQERDLHQQSEQIATLQERMDDAEDTIHTNLIDIETLQTSTYSIQESLQSLQNALQENLYRTTVSYIRGVRTDEDINLLSSSVILSGEPQIYWLEYFNCFAAKVGNSYYRSWGVQEGYDTFNLRYYADTNGKPYTGKLYISLENLNTPTLYRSTTGSTLTRFNTVTLVPNI